MSSFIFTHSLQVFLFLLLHLSPATSIFLQADTQSSIFLHSRCPYYLNLPHLTTAATLCIPTRLYKSTLRFLSFRDTAVYTSISPSSAPSSPDYLCRFSASIAHVSVPYVNTLLTQALYIFSFMWYDVPRAVRIGDNSLNLAQAYMGNNMACEFVVRWVKVVSLIEV